KLIDDRMRILYREPGMPLLQIAHEQLAARRRIWTSKIRILEVVEAVDRQPAFRETVHIRRELREWMRYDVMIVCDRRRVGAPAVVECATRIGGRDEQRRGRLSVPDAHHHRGIGFVEVG